MAQIEKRGPASGRCASAARASPRIGTMSVICSGSTISDGDKAMMSPVTRISRPLLKQPAKTP